jgi:uncharacterized membrane protein
MSPEPSKSNNTLMAALAYLGILVIVPLLTDAKNDPFVKYHIKQGLVLLIAYVICGFIVWVPIIGWLLGVLLFVLFIMGLMNVFAGKQQPLPVIGKYAEKLNI